jgi:hypothetical protein
VEAHRTPLNSIAYTKTGRASFAGDTFANFAGDALANLAGDTFASFAGDTFAMRIVVTILVAGVAGLVVDLEAVGLGAVDLLAEGLVMDFFDTAIMRHLIFKLRNRSY